MEAREYIEEAKQHTSYQKSLCLNRTCLRNICIHISEMHVKVVTIDVKFIFVTSCHNLFTAHLKSITELIVASCLLLTQTMDTNWI